MTNTGLMCSCALCAQQGLTDSGASSAPYTLGTAPGISHPLKWGPSDTLGTSGGVVTWSIVAGGTAIDPVYVDEANGDPSTTTSLSSFLYSGFEQQLRDAFAAWSAVANINFIQVADGGGAVGSDITGNFADIRILAVPFDGPSGTLALTFFPDQGSIGGDMILDSTDGAFFDAHSLFLVATHELGHAIGLDHSTAGSLMNGIYNGALNGLQADDISGAQAIYGVAQPGAAKIYNLPNGQNSITIVNGIANLIINGNDAANVINGSSVAETINGGAGADTMNGGGDDDTYVVDNVGDVVFEGLSAGTDTVQSSVTYILAANVENLTLTGSGNIDGTGNTLANVIIGNTGNNNIDGDTGADTMSGGGGSDTYVVDNVGDVVSEGLSAGTDTVQSSVTYTLAANVENLTLTGAGNIDGTGNELANVMIGNSGNNYLRSGQGIDTLTGGAGDDTYGLPNVGDIVIENPNEGTDTVVTLFSYTLVANVENLTLAGTSNIDGTGNELDNVLLGNSGNNCLNGGLGNNTLTGGSGQDIFAILAAAHATITDFNANQDGIDVVGAGPGNIQVRNSGGSTLIDLNGNNVATLTGVTLQAGDISFRYV